MVDVVVAVSGERVCCTGTNNYLIKVASLDKNFFLNNNFSAPRLGSAHRLQTNLGQSQVLSYTAEEFQ